MTTFTFYLSDPNVGEMKKSYEVTDKEGERILGCFECEKDYEKAFADISSRMMQTIVDHVCAYERAHAADPIVPKPE